MADLAEAAQRVIEGNSNAFESIVNETSAQLVRLGARIMGNLADGEDVVQKAYIRAYESLIAGRFDGRSGVETWLYRIVTNGALDALRARRRRRISSDSLESSSDSAMESAWNGVATADARVALAELDDWLAELPADQRVALTLKAIEGRTSAEVAALMDTTEGAVEQKLVRARATLRKKEQAE